MFLSQIGYPHFELVVYTVETPMTFFNIIDNLDPQNQHINYRLFRDATKFVNGHPTKDVESLNRDPKKVILIDWNKDSVALGMENALLLKKWEGDTKDTGLIGLAQLLQSKNITVCKIKNFSANQILREIIFGDFRSLKKGILDISETPKFDLIHVKLQKFIKMKIRSIRNSQNACFLASEITKNDFT